MIHPTDCSDSRDPLDAALRGRAPAALLAEVVLLLGEAGLVPVPAIEALCDAIERRP